MEATLSNGTYVACSGILIGYPSVKNRVPYSAKPRVSKFFSNGPPIPEDTEGMGTI